jgi:hypothetical protein
MADQYVNHTKLMAGVVAKQYLRQTHYPQFTPRSSE